MDWNEKIKEALERTEFLALSTTGKDGSWTCPVAFGYSEKADLYFISMMNARHVDDILKNKVVSAAIYKTDRFLSGDVVGLQLRGQAFHLTKPDEIKVAAKYYFRRGSDFDVFREETSERKGVDAPWQFFKIQPSELWYFDSRVFNEARKQVDLSSLSLSL